MANLSEFTKESYQDSIDSLSDRYEKMQPLLKSFEVSSLELRKKFGSENSPTNILEGKQNQTLVKLLPLVENELEGGCTLLWKISRHIMLLTPGIEDGNNFGVDVQATCLKQIQDKESFLAGYLGDLGTYFWSRGQVMEKMGGTQWKGDGGTITVEEEKAEDIDHAEEGDLDSTTNGNGDDSKKSKKRKSEPSSEPSSESSTSNKHTTKKTKVTTTKTISQRPNKVLPDYVSYLVSLDLKWHAYLKDALRQASDAYLTVLDNLNKNKAKIENPKGGSGGGEGSSNHMSMF
ncbi:hypothetical protein TL16_g11122 [Triparma laevis f. inornata]|uniref:Proteasome activator PA28 C-terminal domain-containing protein n=2 Tax=Triparma laevis TaxID=1534972 RepID=A0A9W7FSG1_9STRA|nr:hypothetical protein TL16_g11122 [Triparma laevis f. inornata]GMI17215.1 hypothetical protein TrLO_g1325 [Triparma laevis f. longispina]